MIAALDEKANNSDVVKLTGNQTIAGTKTFSTSPVVPTKNTAAGNNPTIIATEAQVYSSSSRIVNLICATAVATVEKVITDATYTLKAGDLISIQFTAGNTANSPTLNINGTGAKQIRLGGGQPTSASGTGSAYCVANNKMMFHYDGEYFWLFGSQDITDDNTTSITSLYGTVANNYKTRGTTAGWTPGAEVRYAMVGICDDGTIDKITATSSSSATGIRAFTPNKISLLENIFVSTATTTAWSIGGIFTQAMYSRLSVTLANWRFPVGQYYNKSGVLVGNDVIVDLNQTPFYVGGERHGNFFIPKEFSLTLRNTSYVYKRIGLWNSAANMYLTDYQHIYIYQNGIWEEMRTADMIAGLNEKANSTDVVKLTGNQTIAGTKTFSTSPVVPTKNAAAGNNPTIIATEAQVYLKENVSNKVTTLTNSTTDYPSTSLLTTELNKKQNTLSEGTGITISGITISASTSYLGSIAKGTGTTTYLRNDGNWGTPTNTTYTASTGLTLSGTVFSASTSYLGSIAKGSGTTTYLRNDGSWQTPPVYHIMPDYGAMDTINQISTNNGTWTVPNSGIYANGGYVYVQCSAYSSSTPNYVYINNKEVLKQQNTSGGALSNGVFPVKVGDIIKISGSTGFSGIFCYFIPRRSVPI